MSATTVRFYEIISAGNGLIADLATDGTGAGPQANLITTEATGTVVAGDWDHNTHVIGVEGNTANTLGWWLYNRVSNLEDWEDGTGNWGVRSRVSASYISSFTSTAIQSSPWVDLPYGSSATPWDLSAAILALNPGNDGTTNL